MADRERGRRRNLLPLAAPVGLVLVLAIGCGGGQQAQPTTAPAPSVTGALPSTSAAPSAALCTAATNFQNATNALVHLNASQVGVDGVRAALQQVQATGNALVTAAQDQYGPQAQQLRQALDALGTTISSLGDQADLSSKLGTLTAAVGAVEAAARPIVDGARAGCQTVSSVELPTT